jgi:hypothetical protein
MTCHFEILVPNEHYGRRIDLPGQSTGKEENNG